VIPQTEKAYNLLHEGSIALAQVEANGIRIDMDYLKKATKHTEYKMKKHQERLLKTDIFKEWKKFYKKKTNYDSTDQLGKVLFDLMGYECTAFTEKGNKKTDEDTLSKIDDPTVKRYFKLKKLKKVMSTYLGGISKEVWKGYLHPQFHLNIVKTYRSSSSNPNFQNLPIRNVEMGNLVRTAFIAREGRQLVELDYSGIEVSIAACYHKDPTMLSYLKDPTKDMHRDMAAQCYKLETDQVTKLARYYGKNMFVFPQFYGDWYIKCASSLWEVTGNKDLVTADGIPIREHLKSKGIHRLGDLNPREKPGRGTFEQHIKNVEKDFWNRRFKVYDKWKRKWYETYKSQGYFTSLTGFTYQGFYTRNEVINYAVQGSAFHCLLWSLIRLQKELRKRNMKTLIIGQIHDSILADVPENELQRFLKLAKWVMTTQLKKNWRWINVPIDIEAEVCPLGGSWADKKEMKIPA